MKNTKSLSSLLILLLCTCGPALTEIFGQADIPISHPVDFISKFQDVHVDDSGEGYVVGRCAVIRKTVTNGQMWETIASPAEGDWSSVACPPTGCTTALVLGDEGLFRLANGSWTEVGVEGMDNGGTLHWLTNDLVLLEGGGDAYYRSTNGGVSWTELSLPGSQRANLSVLDANTLMIWVGSELYKSTDGGATYLPVGYTHPSSVSKQTWLNDQQGWLFDGDRLFFGTSNGGSSWTLLNAESQLTSVNWMEALSETHLVGAQVTTFRLESLDGGVTWTRGSFLPEGNHRVNERYHRRGNEFFTVGDANQLLYSNAGFTDFSEQDPFPRNDRINQVAMASSEVGYAAAGRSFLATTDGMNWAIVSTHNDFIRDMAVLSDGRPVILGATGTKISNDNGVTFTDWVPSGLLANGQYGTVFSRKPGGDYYLLGSNFATVSTDNGVTWTTVNHASDLSYHGLFWLTDDVGYTFTRQQDFAKTTDGGQSWTVSEAPARNLEGIWFTDEMNGWVSSASRRYNTTDGGQTWAMENARGGYDYQLRPGDESILVARYLGGNNGEVSRSTDGGQTWRDLNFNCYAYRAGAVTPDGKYFWTGGDGGFLVRHDLDALIEAANSTGDEPRTAHLSLLAYPNPSSGRVTVGLPTVASGSKLGVYDLTGRQVQSLTVSPGVNRQEVDLTAFPSGTYIIRWQAGGEAGRVKVLKQ